jgi:very-short-patch-repair endonuclease
MPRRSSTLKTHERAKALRHNLTFAELKLWTHLRSHRLRDIHFRRQYSIGNYIVDFCAPRHKLIIELDGSQHLENIERDRERSDFLAGKGYRILRFWNHEVTNNLESVLNVIYQVINDGDK